MEFTRDTIRQHLLVQALVILSLPLDGKAGNFSDDHAYSPSFERSDPSTAAEQNPSSSQSSSTLDSTGAREHPTGDVQEMTSEVFNRLNSLHFPKPSGIFAMDGKLDTSASLLASHEGVQLYAAIRGSQLYVATNPSRLQHADVFLFIAFTPGHMQNAPFGKKGSVASWSAFLCNRYKDTTASWYDASSAPFENIADEKIGSVLEGVIDFELLAGAVPSTIYIAVGKYERTRGGRLIAKLPVSEHNGDIAAAEFYKLAVPGTSRNN